MFQAKLEGFLLLKPLNGAGTRKNNDDNSKNKNEQMGCPCSQWLRLGLPGQVM